MSLYASVAELKARVPERAVSGLSDSFLTQHLTDASDLVDSYVGGRGYELPLATPGNDVKGAVCRIALYTILAARGFSANSDSEVAALEGHDKAVAWLRDVAHGVANLSVLTVTPARRATGMIEYFPGEEEDDWFAS